MYLVRYFDCSHSHLPLVPLPMPSGILLPPSTLPLTLMMFFNDLLSLRMYTCMDVGLITSGYTPSDRCLASVDNLVRSCLQENLQSELGTLSLSDRVPV